MPGISDFSEKSVSLNPVTQFDIWYREHLSFGNDIPESVSLGTVSADGKVSVRTVLLKDYGESGFTFFTNYRSKKARQLASNSSAALLFYWPEKGRQVRIEGIAEQVSIVISDTYFSSRPRSSQLSAWASEQSTEIPGRQYLEERLRHYEKSFSGIPVPRPEHWGGYRIIPEWFEFWEDRSDRLHDRIVYIKEGDSWKIRRLAP